MPVVSCPMCRNVSHLPDPWPHAGFTCGTCRTTVGLAVVVAPSPPVVHLPPELPAAADPFDVADVPARSRTTNYRNRTTVGDSMGQGFGDAFGREMGKILAGCIVAAVIGAGLVIMVFYLRYGR